MGVSKYGYKSHDDSGKAHPSTIKPGLSVVTGSAAKPAGGKKDFVKKSRSTVPPSAKGGDGTKNFVKVVHKAISHSAPVKAKRDVTPSGVTGADGVSVPKKRRR